MTDLPTPEQPDIDYQPLKPNVLDGLPAYLKDPKNYEPVQRKLLETLSCGKLHSDIVDIVECKKCTENMQERKALMKKLGFKSAAQYMAWRKTHEEIKNRVPLDMYNRMIKND